MDLMLRILLAFLSCAIPLAAQSWDAVLSLKAGDAIKVQDTSGKEQKGRFAAASPGAITLATNKGQVSVDKSKIRRVQVKSSSRRLRNAAIGAGIGVALGLIIDNTLGTYLRNESGESSGSRVLTYVAPIGLFSAVGAAASGYRTIYRQ